MKLKKVVLASISGNILEFYDFTIYSIFAFEIGKMFFPKHDENSQIMLSMLIFSIGFISRPIGGILFGHLGDRYGRKTGLTVSMLLMALTTFLIGILPSYEILGVYSSFILSILRFVQGMCLAGEASGTTLFILESTKSQRVGLIGALIASSNIIGMLLAISIGLLINAYIPSLHRWRIAFIFGSFIGIIGLYIRLHMKETSEFLQILKKGQVARFPLKDLLKTNLYGVIQSVFLGGLCGATAYMIIAYLNIYLLRHGVNKSDALNCVLLSTISFTIFMPLCGYLSDRMGSLRTIRYSSIIIVIFMLPTSIALQYTSHPLILFFTLVLLGFFAASINGPVVKFMIELFDIRERYTGMAFSYNLGAALLGSTLPSISLYLESNKIQNGAAFYTIFISILLFVVISIQHKHFTTSNIQKFEKR